MKTGRKENLLPHIRRFVTNEHGENYWFNGCGRYVMEVLGEPDYDYEFFAGITGDVFAQIYAYDHFRGDCVTDYRLSDGEPDFILDIFRQCGYSCTFTADQALKADKDAALKQLSAHIDRGIPVISNLSITGHDRWIVFVGYEDWGDTLLFMTDNMTAPERVSAKEVFAESLDNENCCRGLFFVGEKREQKDLGLLYRAAIQRLPQVLDTKTAHYCFGAAAFRAWADELEGDPYAGIQPGELNSLDLWKRYTNYVCVLATNGSCCYEFLNRAGRLNPDFTFLDALRRLYEKMQGMWEKDADGLEAIGGGFNISLETLQNRQRREQIAGKIREFGDCAEEAAEILKENLPK